MSGDYTRFSFDPRRGYSSVRQQQGRVSLDSDFNEFGEILDYLRRAGTYDTIGGGVYPASTPDGFKIGVAAGGLTIGAGRAYVDGILVECFGGRAKDAPTHIDEHLGQLVGDNALPYSEQPFRYEPGFPAISSAAGTANLLYLDVWAREVTAFEEESLREPALDGQDTTTRIQAAWQVKALAAAAGESNISCAAPPAGWERIIAASEARLTVATNPAQPSPGPCMIDPAGGYTGLENRLYRVEIHQVGKPGDGTVPQFKWSRDNASLAAEVVGVKGVPGPGGVTESIIAVDSTGSDSWTRFETGQHIELLDDDVELALREKGEGGALAEIAEVNHATGEIRVKADLTSFTVNPQRHARMRRWDTDRPADAPSRPTSNGIPIPLENGITVTFTDAAADTLHAGDYWIFAVRTNTGDIVDPVIDQPPRGPLHHFMKLAIVTSGAPPVTGEEDDCRSPWPKPCTCEDEKPEPAVRITGIFWDDVGKTPAIQDEMIDSSTFALGMAISLDKPVDKRTVNRGSTYMTLELPFGGNDQSHHTGYLPIILRCRDGFPLANESVIYWRPDDAVAGMINTALADAEQGKEDNVLARLTLKGSFIYQTEFDLHLDGDAYYAPGVPEHELRRTNADKVTYYSGDGRRGGDFEMWFRIRKPKPAFKGCIQIVHIVQGLELTPEAHLAAAYFRDDMDAVNKLVETGVGVIGRAAYTAEGPEQGSFNTATTAIADAIRDTVLLDPSSATWTAENWPGQGEEEEVMAQGTIQRLLESAGVTGSAGGNRYVQLPPEGCQTRLYVVTSPPRTFKGCIQVVQIIDGLELVPEAHLAAAYFANNVGEVNKLVRAGVGVIGAVNYSQAGPEQGSLDAVTNATANAVAGMILRSPSSATWTAEAWPGQGQGEENMAQKIVQRLLRSAGVTGTAGSNQYVRLPSDGCPTRLYVIGWLRPN